MAKLDGVNAAVLRWARDTSGLSVPDAAASLKISDEKLQAWESDGDRPTYGQLERLAALYRRPIAVFFFPEAPKEARPDVSFRTLPDFEKQKLSSDTLYKIRSAQAFQISLGELTGGANPTSAPVFKRVRLDVSADVEAQARAVEEAVGYKQIAAEGENGPASGVEEWRSAIEESGIFVFKESFKQREISGFCLTDDEFPVIMVNNTTARSRQLFTLIHELSHILVGESSLTKLDDSYLSELSEEDASLERFCNAVAAEILLPRARFEAWAGTADLDEENISAAADHFGTSREVVLRRLVDSGRKSPADYARLVRKWLETYEESRAKSSGGSYYNTRAHYLSSGFMRVAFESFYRGRISQVELADHLGVRPKSLEGIERRFLRMGMS